MPLIDGPMSSCVAGIASHTSCFDRHDDVHCSCSRESLNRFDSMTTRRERGGGRHDYIKPVVLFLDGMNRHFAKMSPALRKRLLPFDICFDACIF